jgi:hypothetical protein
MKKTGVNPIKVNVTNVSQMALGTNPKRIGIIWPAPTGVNSYQVSFNSGFGAGLAYNMQPSGLNETWWSEVFGETITQRIWILGNGSFTIEVTEIVCAEEEE